MGKPNDTPLVGLRRKETRLTQPVIAHSNRKNKSLQPTVCTRKSRLPLLISHAYHGPRFVCLQASVLSLLAGIVLCRVTRTCRMECPLGGIKSASSEISPAAIPWGRLEDYGGTSFRVGGWAGGRPHGSRVQSFAWVRFPQVMAITGRPSGRASNSLLLSKHAPRATCQSPFTNRRIRPMRALPWIPPSRALFS